MDIVWDYFAPFASLVSLLSFPAGSPLTSVKLQLSCLCLLVVEQLLRFQRQQIVY
jgi:hypothetical protein